MLMKQSKDTSIGDSLAEFISRDCEIPCYLVDQYESPYGINCLIQTEELITRNAVHWIGEKIRRHVYKTVWINTKTRGCTFNCVIPFGNMNVR